MCIRDSLCIKDGEEKGVTASEFKTAQKQGWEKQYQNHAATIISWTRQDHPASRQRNYESEEYETL